MNDRREIELALDRESEGDVDPDMVEQEDSLEEPTLDGQVTMKRKKIKRKKTKRAQSPTR